MPRREGSFKAGPACCLRLITAVSRLQDIDAGIFPFEIRPTASPVLGRLENLPSLIGPTGREQGPRSWFRRTLRGVAWLSAAPAAAIDEWLNQKKTVATTSIVPRAGSIARRA